MHSKPKLKRALGVFRRPWTLLSGVESERSKLQTWFGWLLVLVNFHSGSFSASSIVHFSWSYMWHELWWYNYGLQSRWIETSQSKYFFKHTWLFHGRRLPTAFEIYRLTCWQISSPNSSFLSRSSLPWSRVPKTPELRFDPRFQHDRNTWTSRCSSRERWSHFWQAVWSSQNAHSWQPHALQCSSSGSESLHLRSPSRSVAAHTRSVCASLPRSKQCFRICQVCLRRRICDWRLEQFLQGALWGILVCRTILH